MPSEIQPQYLTFAKLCHLRLFSIPDYQRAYSWKKRQRDDLFHDIRNIFQKGGDDPHFMATIVCLNKRCREIGTEEYYELDIVDGQQRLTTLVLILNCIKKYLAEENEEHESLKNLLVKKNDNLLLLQTNQDGNQYFSKFIRLNEIVDPDTDDTHADRELLSAIQECHEFVGEWNKEHQDLLRLSALIKNKLSFILHEVSDEKHVYKTFEVLNSRGIEVSWLDRLKTILMGLAFDLDDKKLIEELKIIWRDIYRKVGTKLEISSEALRFAATLFLEEPRSSLLGERDAVDSLRAYAGEDKKKIREVANWVLDVTKELVRVTKQARLTAVTRLSQPRLLAVAIGLSDFEPEQKEILLDRWEKVSFRIYGLFRKDSRFGRGDYVRLSWNTLWGDELMGFDFVRSEINRIGDRFPIDEAIDEIKGENCYEEWQEELRYFMYRYEEWLAKKEGIALSETIWDMVWKTEATKSIEHITPQSKGTRMVHNIGNLLILPPGVNSKLRDLPPRKKFRAYRDTGLRCAVEVSKSTKWNDKFIREREDKLLEWARSEWGD